MMSGIDDWGDFPDDIIEDGIEIATLLDVGDTFVYRYDYGYGWEQL